LISFANFADFVYNISVRRASVRLLSALESLSGSFRLETERVAK